MGTAAAGRSYDLYSEMDGLPEFPVPAWLVPKILLLEFGPWQFNIMGRYVVLLLLSPYPVGATRKLGWLVLLVSAAVYAAGALSRIRYSPPSSKIPFP